MKDEEFIDVLFGIALRPPAEQPLMLFYRQNRATVPLAATVWRMKSMLEPANSRNGFILYPKGWVVWTDVNGTVGKTLDVWVHKDTVSTRQAAVVVLPEGQGYQLFTGGFTHYMSQSVSGVYDDLDPAMVACLLYNATYSESRHGETS